MLNDWQIVQLLTWRRLCSIRSVFTIFTIYINWSNNMTHIFFHHSLFSTVCNYLCFTKDWIRKKCNNFTILHSSNENKTHNQKPVNWIRNKSPICVSIIYECKCHATIWTKVPTGAEIASTFDLQLIATHLLWKSFLTQAIVPLGITYSWLPDNTAYLK